MKEAVRRSYPFTQQPISHYLYNQCRSYQEDRVDCRPHHDHRDARKEYGVADELGDISDPRDLAPEFSPSYMSLDKLFKGSILIDSIDHLTRGDNPRALFMHQFPDHIVLGKDVAHHPKPSDRLKCLLPHQHRFADDCRYLEKPIQEGDMPDNEGVEMQIFQQGAEGPAANAADEAAYQAGIAILHGLYYLPEIIGSYADI